MLEVLIIRAAASTQIGSGHNMRCLALAQAWKKQDGKVIIISTCESESLRNRIIDEGFELVLDKEHYGLGRKEGAKVHPRHSWNSNHFMSNIILYNLPRHSHHHEKAYLEFWNLEAYEDAPEMPYGYLYTIYIALLCPWWYH